MTDDRRRYQIALVVLADVEGVDESDAEAMGRSMLRRLVRGVNDRLTASRQSHSPANAVNWEMRVHAIETLEAAFANGYMRIEPTMRAAARGRWADMLDNT